MTFQTASEDGFAYAKREAQGKWGAIIGTRYPALAGALTIPGVSRCTCPVHGSSKEVGDGFRVYKDFEQTGGGVCNTCGSRSSGIDLIMWLENCSSHEALKILESELGIDSKSPVRPKTRTPSPAPKPKQEDSEAIKKREQTLEKIWSEATPLSELDNNHHAIRYFVETRGINSVGLVKSQKNIRFNPELFYASREEGQSKLPGFVSLFHTSNGQSVGLHRTFLDPKGPVKADVLKPKMMLKRLDQRLNGGIRIQGSEPLTSHVNICEGLETAMSISYSTGKSIIAATTGTLLGAWKPLKGVRYVTIWCDNDINRAGQNHSEHLVGRLEDLGIKTRVLCPKRPHDTESVDWNDVLLSEGIQKLARSYSAPFTT